MLASIRAAKDPLGLTYKPNKPATSAKVQVDIGRISAKVRSAVMAMVWDGMTRRLAARHAGLSEHSLYVAFLKPQVKQLYNQQLEVLRNSERARNIHALCETRDQTVSWNARVSAVNALESMDNQRGGTGGPGTSAGFVIQVITSPGTTVAGHVIEHEPIAPTPNCDE